MWALAFALEVSQNFLYFISIVIVMDGRLLVVYIYLPSMSVDNKV